ncbi:MAG: superoxide dismutase family protein [Casimicrobiaceae bacterium]
MRFTRLAAALIIGAAAGCATMGTGEYRATTTLEPTKGNTTAGTVTFVQRGGSVHVVADIRGLKPNSEHGFHVHEKGDCSSGDGTSAGGHFNPEGVAHGAGAGHAGDMPNLKADANGNARASFDATRMTVAEGKSGIVGKGLIVHKDPDDYKTQPTGNAGARIACGVIKAA